MVVLDTNMIIDFLEGKEKVVAAVAKYPAAELAMTFVNKYELLKYQKRERLEAAIENLLVYHSNDNVLKAASNAYRMLKSRGAMMSDNDLLIFGTCIANNEVLLTQDKAFGNLHSNMVIVIE